jgi:triacylglycerol lipase
MASICGFFEWLFEWISHFTTRPVSKDKSDPEPSPDVKASLAPKLSNLRGDDWRNEVRWDVALTLARLSDLAYETDGNKLKEQLRHLGATDSTPIAEGDSEGLVTTDGAVVAVAFRGTTSLKDIVSDVWAFANTTTKGFKTHGGFSGAVETIYHPTLAAVRRYWKVGMPVWITGHSLGGAMAMVFAQRLQDQENIPVTGLYTYGQPLVMDENHCRAIIDAFGTSYVRFVNLRDPVTLLLPTPYRHAGVRVQLLGGNYKYRPPKIAYTNAGPDAPATDIAPWQDEDLPPLSREAVDELERKLKQQVEPVDRQRVRRERRRSGAGAPQGFAVFPSIDIMDVIDDHFMAGYVAQISELGGRHFVVQEKPTP